MKNTLMEKEIKILKKQLKNQPIEKQGYLVTKHLADGHAGSVFLAEKNNQDYVLKIMAPSMIPGKLMYRLFFQEQHGYFDENAVNAAFYRRKIANKIVKPFDSDIEMLEANEQSNEYNGFYMPFVEHPKANTLEEKAFALKKVTKLKNFFNELGMPSWSFNPDYPFYDQRSDNIRLNGNKIIIIDYESGVLTPSNDGYMDLDPVDFETVNKHIQGNKNNLLDCLGHEEHKILLDSFEKCKHYTELWHAGEKRTLQKIKSKKGLEETIRGLVDEGILSSEDANKLDVNEGTNYILKQLGVHLGIGFTVGLFTGPIPVGLIPRGLWTIGNKIYHSLKGNKEKAKVHSLGVLGWSSIPIPVVNYFGYLLPLKKANESSALVHAEHMVRSMKGESLRDYLLKKPKFIQSMVKKAVIPKDKMQFYGGEK